MLTVSVDPESETYVSCHLEPASLHPGCGQDEEGASIPALVDLMDLAGPPVPSWRSPGSSPSKSHLRPAQLLRRSGLCARGEV